MSARKADGQALVIVESPAKARTINKYLGPNYIVKASMGHVRDLPAKEFGIDVSADFEPTYEIVKGRTKVIHELEKLARSTPLVYLATDRDREGEAIAWHLMEALRLPPERVRRVIFNEITRDAIRDAFASAHAIDMDRVNAQQARRILDRIVGYELSPLLWRKIAKGLSAGRVQSVAVRLIVEREREILAFVPDESWKIAAYVAPDAVSAERCRPAWREFRATAPTQKDVQRWLGQQECFRTELVEVGGQPFRATDAEAARAVAEALGFRVQTIVRRPWDEYQNLKLQLAELSGGLDAPAACRLTVAELKTKRTLSRPAPPFTTATLQQVASTVLRFPASRTMRTAQSLYEGVDVNGEGTVGLITYMRTDSTNLAADAVAHVRDFIHQHYGPRYLPPQPNVYAKRQERAQEAHEAIRPTDPNRTPESLRRALSADQHKLYTLIWTRFVACQMPPAEWESTTVHLTGPTPLGEARFTGAGRKLVFDGYMKVAGVTSADQLLPTLAPGQAVGLLDLEPRQQFTSPPPRYTEASLIKALEAEGIGRPSTYATILDTIQERGYVEQLERQFRPTALGELVTDKLVQHFPKIMDVKFTSFMEDELDKIEDARLDWRHVLHEFYDPFRELLTRAGEEMAATRGQPSTHPCPACAAPMVYRWSKTGRFLACSQYPRCKTTLNVDRDGRPVVPTPTEHLCEACGRPMLRRQSRAGLFLGCSGYPECRNTVTCDEHGEPLRLVAEADLERTCDICGTGRMVVKRKGRRAFLGCNRFPECKNTAALPAGVRLASKPAPAPEPAGINCEKCGRPMVVRRGRRGRFIACSGFPRCRATKPHEKLEELRAATGGPAAGGATPTADTSVNSAPPSAGPSVHNTHPTADQRASGAAPTATSGTGTVAEAHPQFGVPPAGFAWTRTGRPVVETWPERGSLTCPECGSTMELKRGRFGPFFSCTNFPKCRFNANLRGAAKRTAEERLPAPERVARIVTDIPCPECGNPMVVRRGRRGRFLGCGSYPKCKGTQELPAGFDAGQAPVSAGTAQ